MLNTAQKIPILGMISQDYIDVLAKVTKAANRMTPRISSKY